MTEEKWLPVVGYEGLYEVSDHGRVRSLDRIVMRPVPGGTPHPMRLAGRMRSQYSLKRGGYIAVSLCRDNRSHSRSVHTIVAEAFIGPRPEGMQVRHLDGDKTNNTPSNLAYGTPLENADDLRRHGNHHNTRKTHCPSGHAYDKRNTYLDPKGHRFCISCRIERNAKQAAA